MLIILFGVSTGPGQRYVDDGLPDGSENPAEGAVLRPCGGVATDSRDKSCIVFLLLKAPKKFNQTNILPAKLIFPGKHTAYQVFGVFITQLF